MDVDTVLLSVQERDNWRRRLELLEQTLLEVRDRRIRVEARVKRIKRALHDLAQASEALISPLPIATTHRIVHGADTPLRFR
jgi:hypothetical protein